MQAVPLDNNEDIDFEGNFQRTYAVAQKEDVKALVTPHLRCQNLLNYVRNYTFTPKRGFYEVTPDEDNEKFEPADPNVDPFAEYMKKWAPPDPCVTWKLPIFLGVMRIRYIYICIYQTSQTYLGLEGPQWSLGRRGIYMRRIHTYAGLWDWRFAGTR